MTTREKRDARKSKTGEVFTPPALTNEILDKLPKDVWEPSKTFCDPAAGNGNILLEIFKRKISLGHDWLQALSTIFGVDLMADNVEECKERFLEIVPSDLHEQAKVILDKQIICHDALSWNFISWKSGVLKHKKMF